LRPRGSASRGTTAADYHPWRHAEALGVDVRIDELDDCLGYWDADTRTIHLARGLTQRQRRAVLAHEVEHASNDDRPLLDAVLHARRERATDAVAARRLIPVELLAQALRWTGHERELADELWVDVHTVRVRLASLTARERRALDVLLTA
jgi:hypothetical protein